MSVNFTAPIWMYVKCRLIKEKRETNAHENGTSQKLAYTPLLMMMIPAL
jgi:hypothetical protein